MPSWPTLTVIMATEVCPPRFILLVRTLERRGKQYPGYRRVAWMCNEDCRPGTRIGAAGPKSFFAYVT
jgi:hypothetical protein